MNEWSKADPPIAFLNASPFTGFINVPNLRVDLENASGDNNENSFTLLSSNLDDCTSEDAAEWKYWREVEKQLHKEDFSLYDWRKEDKEERTGTASEPIILDEATIEKQRQDHAKQQKDKLWLLLKLCGGFKKEVADKVGNMKWVPLRDTKKREALVNKLYEENKDYALTWDNILKIVV